jgi:hypothetical protein
LRGRGFRDKNAHVLRAARRIADLALVACGTLAGLLLLEAGFRARAALEDRGLLSVRLELPPDPARDQPAPLGRIIRRSADPRLVYELRPNLQVLYEGARLTTNRHGLRGRERDPAQTSGVFRIVGLGDSFMFGFGVADDQTYLARLESRLSGSGVEVVNLAVPGYNGAMEVRSLELKGLAYAPELVIIEFISNDFDLPNFIWLPRNAWAWDRSFLVDFVRERWARGRRAPTAQLVDAPTRGEGATRLLSDPARVPPLYAGLVGQEAYVAAMRRLADLSERHGFRVVLMGWDAIPEEERIRELGRSLGFHVFDLRPTLSRYLRRHGYADYLGSPLARGTVDAHPTPLGHALIAEWLHTFLADERLLPAPPPAAAP